MSEETKKATFSLPKNVIEKLKAQSVVEGTPVNSIVRRAIAIELLMLDKTRKGGKVIIEDSDGKMHELIRF